MSTQIALFQILQLSQVLYKLNIKVGLFLFDTIQYSINFGCSIRFLRTRISSKIAVEKQSPCLMCGSTLSISQKTCKNPRARLSWQLLMGTWHHKQASCSTGRAWWRPIYTTILKAAFTTCSCVAWQAHFTVEDLVLYLYLGPVVLATLTSGLILLFQLYPMHVFSIDWINGFCHR